ncbi:ArnT family glycosyltransferase [Streptomyces sp. NPDC001667]
MAAAPTGSGQREKMKCFIFSPRTAGLGALFTLALFARLVFIDRAYDVFVDEIYYSAISQNLAIDGELTFNGQFFALHPPALFTVLALVIHAIRPPGGLLSLVLALRPVIAVEGAIVVAAVTMLLRRVVRPQIATAAGLMLALDPFLNRFDSRVMLETQATAAAALGLLVLARCPANRRGAITTGFLAGLLFAFAVTTKETYILVTLVPLLLLVFRARGRVRSVRLTAAAVTIAGYMAYVAAVIAAGCWSPWWEQKTDGLARAVGVKQITGFNSLDGSANLADRMLARLGQFGISYAVIALGTCATAWLVWRHTRRPLLFAEVPGRSLVTAWAGCSLTSLLYSMILGTLEEQMFYPALVASTAALALATDLALPEVNRTKVNNRPRFPLITVITTLTATALVVNSGVWWHVHSQRDDSRRRTSVWIRSHISERSTVAATDDTTALSLPQTQLQTLYALCDLMRNHVDYVLVSTQLISQGYAQISPSLVTLLSQQATLVHSESGPTAGELRVYDVRTLTSRSHSETHTGVRGI